MNRLVILAAGAALLTLGACQREVRMEHDDADANGAPRVISRLDCPEKQGELTRVSASPDGKTCAYQAEGAEVSLRLVALTNGDAKAALAPIEAELKGVIPAPAKTAQAAAASDEGGERTEIDFPGLHIKADGSGADIRIGGVRIDADNDGGAQVRVGEQTVVNAGEDGAEIRNENAKNGIRSTYILASDKAPGGYHVVGYEARGPRTGPLVVAVVKAKGEHRRHDLFDDMKDLVERNVGE